MSKTYEALLRTEREQAARRKGAVLSKPAPEPQIEEPKRKAKQGIQPIGPDFHHEGYIGRIPVDNLIAERDSILAEQFRKLQGIVISHNMVNSLRSILVTSCMAKEGKTSVALNLSAVIASGLDNSAILIDADLRKRELSHLLGLGNISGLSHVLEERVTIEEALVDTKIESLTILPAGTSPSNPAELITLTRMKALIRQLEASHKGSYIIIDSTPIISTSEASALSQITDGVIVVIMADKTRRDVVKRELKTIKSEKILGVVLNCAEFETSDYYHGYYKGYYGKKKK